MERTVGSCPPPEKLAFNAGSIPPRMVTFDTYTDWLVSRDPGEIEDSAFKMSGRHKTDLRAFPPLPK